MSSAPSGTFVPQPPARSAPPPVSPRLIGAVAAGGVLGALARDALTRAAGTPATGFPWATCGINVGGSFLLGVLVGTITVRPGLPSWLRPLIGTGVLGGFTTYSTFAVETDRLVSLGRTGLAVGNVAVTLLAALAVSMLGLRSGRRLGRRTR